MTGQLVYQRDWPKVHGRHYKDMPIFSLTFGSGIDNFNFYIKIVLVAQNSFRTLKELHFPFLKAFFARIAAVKVAFFQKAWCIFLIAQKMCRKLSQKRDFEIAFCVKSADSNCTAVSKGRKIQNTKLRIEHSTFLGNGNNTNIFPRKSDL